LKFQSKTLPTHLVILCAHVSLIIIILKLSALVLAPGDFSVLKRVQNSHSKITSFKRKYSKGSQHCG